MEKPSRRRRPLLRPLPHPRFTHFILSRRHPVRLRMGERGRQIRCSDRSRVTPRRTCQTLTSRSRVTPRPTCQTLTSSGKVEAASMSDKCEIRSDADPNQGDGGPGQVAQVSNFEATHSGSSARPPLDLLYCPDIFKSLESDRLVPCDVKTTNPAALKQYDDYLAWFYKSHRDPTPDASLADTASMCLDKENSMKSLWVSVNACCSMHSGTAGKFIADYMNIAIEENGKIEHPFGIDAAKCIAKEAELISEWLRRGRRIFTDDDYILCDNIRVVCAQLFVTRREWSIEVAAALLGIRKEAEWLIENPKCDSDESIINSMLIRKFAVDLAQKKFGELKPYESEESSEDEMASDSDDESNADVSENEDNNYVGYCCDEDFLKYYFR